MEQEKDYSLLRQFDLEAAKRGEAICYAKGTPAKYIAGPNRLGTVVVHWENDQFHFTSKSNLRMAPLAWVEGKPVYKGDVLYGTEECSGYRYDVIDVTEDGLIIQSAANETGACQEETRYLTWAPPNVKREGWFMVIENLGRRGTIGPFDSERQAENARPYEARPVTCFRHEWEEPAGQEGGAA